MTASIEARPFSARACDGFVLRGDILAPEKPRAVALALHAMMVNRRTMDRPAGSGLASTLASRGIAVINADFRAHGESTPRVGEGATPTYDDFIVHDIPALLAKARATFEGLPLAVVGHSLGGHTTLIFSGLLPYRAPDALVMLGANLWLGRTEPSPIRRFRKAASLAAFEAIACAFGRFDSKRLGVGTDSESLPYVRQFGEFWRSDRLTSRDGSIDYDRALATACLPVLSIASDGDSLLGHPEAVRSFVALAARADVTHRRISFGELGAEAPDHMGLVTSAKSRPLWNEIADWILTRLC